VLVFRKSHRFTEERLDEIRMLSEKEDVYERLARAIAPSIYENEDIKKGILLQLFGGTKKTFEVSGRKAFRWVKQLYCTILQENLILDRRKFVVECKNGFFHARTLLATISIIIRTILYYLGRISTFCFAGIREQANLSCCHTYTTYFLAANTPLAGDLRLLV